eukprot:TRINITY_DN5269_c0_g1_i2.p1 TRINITY_DN5269_c0_g1~~TRINITY_DN5269_c0_g1_i2.p1  ORF type:complete len:876 (-),score=293.91 TRINITY_DN5269_c0_g1_i2:77-2704(-)
MDPRNAAVRYSVVSLSQLSQKVDLGVTDSFISLQQKVRTIKADISTESRKNYQLEKQIRVLDQKIALLVKNRITLEEAEAAKNEAAGSTRAGKIGDEKTRKAYENMFFLLQSQPRYLADLLTKIKMAEIDNLLQTVMFTLYGNQYDPREEDLLLRVFGRVLNTEFSTATSMGTLMRANTALTRMMTTYTRRGPGQAFLKSTLSPLLGWVCKQSELNLEINPMKMYEALINEEESRTGQPSALPRSVTTEVAAEHPGVIALVPERTQQLLDLSQRFFDAITENPDAVPYGLRWICKHIYECAKAKFPDATRYELSSLQGGFLLLRFVNPAIVTPNAYMLIETKPGPNARKNLTYVAKLLQNLSNGARFGGKEVYMEPLDAFLTSNQEKLAAFFDRVREIEEPEKAFEYEAILAMARSNSETVVNIGLNEIFFFHGLLQTYLEDLKLEPRDPLRLVLADLDKKAPEAVKKEENVTVALHLWDRFEAPLEQASTADQQRLHAQHTNTNTNNNKQTTNNKQQQINNKQTVEQASTADQQRLHAQHTNTITNKNKQQRNKQTSNNKQQPKTNNKQTVEQASTADQQRLHAQHTNTITNKNKQQRNKQTSNNKQQPKTNNKQTVEQASTADQQRLHAQHIYVETKHLLFTLFRAMPEFSKTAETSSGLLSALDTCQKLAHQTGDTKLSETIKKIIKNLSILETNRLVSRSDNFSDLRRDIAEEMANVEKLQTQMQKEFESLSTVYSSIKTHNQFLTSQLQTYEAYLDSVRQKAYTPKEGKKESGKEVKVTHQQLEKDGVILESDVPEDRRSNVYFIFTAPSPGVFLAQIFYKGRGKPVFEITLMLDELLEMQHTNELELTLDYMKLHVNLLIHFLRKHFIK